MKWINTNIEDQIGKGEIALAGLKAKEKYLEECQRKYVPSNYDIHTLSKLKQKIGELECRIDQLKKKLHVLEV